ncbi:MAG: Phage endopeptidase [uncultured Sphingomonas sp.]|uniref:Phage endopeptidase n=1 Tax=uncultured Sphingomonas sp. TaxID=158754 RepID=A0A6J4SIH3_9SPHN|nr:M23 family metallopeptidase [uncultured Sphingomonas sp.]CAA9494396.1 MAG: Phage endopeptidase [uncultured Sphingomonas sp.]
MFYSPIVPQGGRPLTAMPRSFGIAVQRPQPGWLIVDLGADLFSPRWWCGLLTLFALTASAALLAPGLEPLPGGRPAPLEPVQLEQWQALAIAPLSEGSDTGLEMLETKAVRPLLSVPRRTSLSLFATLGASEGIARLLLRSGAAAGDAAETARLIAGAGRAIAPGTSVAIILGEAGASGRRVQQVSLRAGLDLKLTVQRGGGGLALVRTAIPIDTAPLRIRGRVGGGLYWSLRSAGASPEVAAAYLQALATAVEVGSEVAADDRFDLVLANRRAASGESIAGPLLYAGLERNSGAAVQLLRWPVGGRLGWVDAANAGRPAPSSAGLQWPVQGRITSGFGRRVHPILRFARMHRGIDFGAGWGAPIVAAADGQVVRAGWAGGYGRQVRIAHGDGLLTSYSHMSRIIVDAGGAVRAGQLIGYVGSSGLSTGPHLHYETIRNGVAVDPLSVRFASVRPVDAGEMQAIRTRLKALLGA